MDPATATSSLSFLQAWMLAYHVNELQGGEQSGRENYTPLRDQNPTGNAVPHDAEMPPSQTAICPTACPLASPDIVIAGSETRGSTFHDPSPGRRLTVPQRGLPPLKSCLQSTSIHPTAGIFSFMLILHCTF